MLAFIFSSLLLDMLRVILYTHEEEIMKILIMLAVSIKCMKNIYCCIYSAILLMINSKPV